MIAVTAFATTATQLVIHTPASGKAVRLRWATATSDPDASTSPLIKIGYDEVGGERFVYSGYGISHLEPTQGEVDARLVVRLDKTGRVAITCHIEEV